MKGNLNFKLARYLKIMLGIIFVLSIIIIYQNNTINKLRNEQATDFFLETKLKREQTTAKTLYSLKALIDDKKVSKESRNVAETKYANIVTAANNETYIELILKSKGYDNVVVIITDDKVRVIIKNDKKLSNKQLKQIRDTVISVTKIKDIEVEIK